MPSSLVPNSRHAPVSVAGVRDRKSTRLNSSHTVISYAVFCLKKKKNHRVGTAEQTPLVALDQTILETVARPKPDVGVLFAQTPAPVDDEKHARSQPAPHHRHR